MSTDNMKKCSLFVLAQQIAYTEGKRDVLDLLLTKEENIYAEDLLREVVNLNREIVQLKGEFESRTSPPVEIPSNNWFARFFGWL
jgi:hypothetical protein